MSDETKINGKVWKKIQAGQDWKDPETWYGMLISIGLVMLVIYGHYAGWWKQTWI